MKSSLQNEIIELINNDFPNLKSLKYLLSPTLLFSLDESNVKSNFSKIGGNPIIAEENIQNPNQLKFIGQIDLNEYKKIDEKISFKGIVYFYLRENLDTYPITKNDYSVFFVRENELENLEYSKIKDGNSLNFIESYTIPSYQENSILNSTFEYNQFEDLEEIILDANSTTTNFDYDFAHQILGEPQALQGSVRFWWAISYLGFEEKSSYSEIEKTQIKNIENDILLLLQLNLSDQKINHSAFGDGILYFGIHKDDFENGRFEKALLTIQNT